MPDKKYILAVMGGGRGYTLSDQDMWGLRDAMIHCNDTGYFNENKEWAEAMLDRIRKLRSEGEEEDGD